MNYGTACAALAFVLWGVFPLYFRLLLGGAGRRGADEPHRLVAAVCWLLILAARHLGLARPRAAQPRMLGAFAASASLLSGNWLTYIWAVDQATSSTRASATSSRRWSTCCSATSLLHERPRRAQWLALASRCRRALAHRPRRRTCRGSAWCSRRPSAATGCCARSRRSARSRGWRSRPCCSRRLRRRARLWWGARQHDSFPAPDWRPTCGCRPRAGHRDAAPALRGRSAAPLADLRSGCCST